MRTLDIAKRMLDHGVHPPTVYFPLLVEEALMIEPTETETKERLDHFADVVRAILEEAAEDPEIARTRPTRLPCAASTRPARRSGRSCAGIRASIAAMPDAPEGTVVSDQITQEELAVGGAQPRASPGGAALPITPAGLHYLLIHYDIPAVDADAFTLEVDGAVERPLSLSLDDLKQREQVSLPVTFECAGNGRARLDPRPLSQPWLTEAVGTAEWAGTALAPLLAEAGVRPGAVEALFSGPRPRLRERRRAGLRACAGADGDRERDARLRDERRTAAAAARLPAAAGGAGLVRDDERQVARPASRCSRSPSRATRTPSRIACTTPTASPGAPITRMLPRSLMVPPGRARLHEPRAPPGARAGHAAGSRLVGLRAGRARRAVHRRGRHRSRTRSWSRRSAGRRGAAGITTGTRPRASTCSARAPPTRPATSSRSRRSGT